MANTPGQIVSGMTCPVCTPNNPCGYMETGCFNGNPSNCDGGWAPYGGALMKNCGLYNVYYLKPAKFCPSAYCVA